MKIVKTTLSKYLAKIGKKGGQAKTTAKALASRLNGMQGGRGHRKARIGS